MASLPSSSSRWIQFKHGYALGICNLWDKGQYCSIITPAGIVGCGIYDLKTPAEFDQAIAIAKGTPANPLKEPEDLFEAKIVGMTPKAASFGIALGMTGREAVELMQIASLKIEALPIENPTSLLQVKAFDHITLVVKDLKALMDKEGALKEESEDEKDDMALFNLVRGGILKKGLTFWLPWLKEGKSITSPQDSTLWL